MINEIERKCGLFTAIIKLIPLCLMAVVGLIYGLSTETLQNNLSVDAQVAGVSANPLFAAVCVAHSGHVRFGLYGDRLRLQPPLGLSLVLNRVCGNYDYRRSDQ